MAPRLESHMTEYRRTLTGLTLGVIALFPFLQARVAAQQPPKATGDVRQGSGFCYASRPSPECASYLIFEITGAVRLAGTTRLYAPTAVPYVGCTVGCAIEDQPGYIAWDLGYMKNKSSRYALGGSLQVGGNEDGVRLALRARSRLFVSRYGVVDLAAGPLAQRIGRAAEPREAYGGTADVTLGVRRVGGLMIGTDILNDRNRIASAVHGGMRLESWPGAAATALVAVGGILTVVALSRGTW